MVNAYYILSWLSLGAFQLHTEATVSPESVCSQLTWKPRRRDIRRFTIVSNCLRPRSTRDFTAGTERPMIPATSAVDSSPSILNSTALRIPGFNSFIAADRISFCSCSKHLYSAFGLESRKSRDRAAPFSAFGWTSGISTLEPLFRKNMHASFLTMLVNHVEKEECPSHVCRCMNAF